MDSDFGTCLLSHVFLFGSLGVVLGGWDWKDGSEKIIMEHVMQSAEIDELDEGFSYAFFLLRGEP